MGEQEYSFLVDDRVRVHVRIKTKRGDVEEFVVQVMARFDGEWRELVRFDNCHGSPPHRHLFHPDGTESSHPYVAVLPKTFLDQAIKDLKDRVPEWLDDYDRDRSNLDRGVR